MDDLTELPDEYLPKIDDLPGELAQLAREIAVITGDEQAVRIVLHLEQQFRGTAVYFHNLDQLRRKVRDRTIIERYTAGEKADDIARSVGRSSRQIWNILGREPHIEDSRQLSLWK